MATVEAQDNPSAIDGAGAQSPRKKLIVVTNTIGFFLSHRLHLTDGAHKAGYDICLIAPMDQNADKLKNFAVTFLPISLRRKSINPYYELRTLFQFYRHLRSVRPDVLHLFTIKPVVYGAFLARFIPIPRVVVTITGLGYVFMRSGFIGRALRQLVGGVYRQLFRHESIKVIFQNHDDQNLFLENGWIVGEKTTVIPGTGVDTIRFRPVVKQQFDKKIIVFPARMLKDKGVVEIVEAGSFLYTKRKDFEIWLCGEVDDGNPTSLTAAQYKEFSKLPFVRARGHCADMTEIYNQAHIVCLPSYREGIPLSLIEACACGLPVVTTDVPGCREVILHGENGLLVPPQNPEALAFALQKLIEDDALRIKMGFTGRLRAEEKYAKEIVVAQNLAVYDS